LTSRCVHCVRRRIQTVPCGTDTSWRRRWEWRQLHESCECIL